MTQMTIQQAIDAAVRHHQTGRLAEAEAIYRQVLSADPNQPDALHLLGVVACQVGQFEAAADLFGRAINQPNSADFHSNLGNALQSLNRRDEAVVAYRNALSLNPGHAETHNNLGCALRDAGRTDEAIATFRQALALRPGYAEALINLANALRDAGHFQESIDTLQTSLASQPNIAETHNSLGAVFEQQGNYSQAIAEYHQALALAPNHIEAHVNLGIAMLRDGDYPNGWKEYEWRLQRKDMLNVSSKLSRKPRWVGQALSAQTLLLYTEQGFGDTLQFVRYAPLLAERGYSIILHCQPELRELLRNMSGVQSVISDTEVPFGFDAHCPLASLPFVLGTTLQTIPTNIPYLQADPERANRWKDRIGDHPGLKIGLVWAGREQHRDDRNRSIPLSMLSDVLNEHAVRFISLQKGLASAQRADSIFQDHIADWTSDIHDFSDTAALIHHLDLVITVDTAVAHLAAAMGKAVWVLVPFVPDWRWMRDRKDSPWYPKMRLFRQPAIGEWDTPIQEMATMLSQLKMNPA